MQSKIYEFSVAEYIQIAQVSNIKFRGLRYSLDFSLALLRDRKLPIFDYILNHIFFLHKPSIFI